MKDLETANVATLLILIGAVVGAALVILSAVDAVSDPALKLSFSGYFESLAIGAGLLGIGRGLKARRG